MTDMHGLNEDKQANEKQSGLIFNCFLLIGGKQRK